MSCPHPGSSTPSDLAMQGSTVMRQSGAATLATEEPDALIAHVRVCGGAGWVTIGSTRKLTAYSLRFATLRCGFRQQLKAGVRRQNDALFGGGPGEQVNPN